eukprot:GHVL01024071.1.p1 GENE.GHVL01024071.1~~GHVL01024071.1.p1  ORF type:complete len:143 (+),score=18.83 GHVL01024071.1:572-1000(+)
MIKLPSFVTLIVAICFDFGALFSLLIGLDVWYSLTQGPSMLYCMTDHIGNYPTCGLGYGWYLSLVTSLLLIPISAFVIRPVSFWGTWTGNMNRRLLSMNADFSLREPEDYFGPEEEKPLPKDFTAVNPSINPTVWGQQNVLV